MLRKVVNHLPLIRLTNTTPLYHFSQQNKQTNQHRNKSLKSSLLEKVMIQYAERLETATNNIKKSGAQLNPRFKVFNFFTKKVKKQGIYQQKMSKIQNLRAAQQNEESKEKKQTDNSQAGDKNPSMRLAIYMAISAFLFKALLSNQDQRSSFNQRVINSSKVINQNQMINLLSAGAMNPEIIIIRQLKNKATNPHSEHTFQTICIAKETSKGNAPKMCMINNLANFLGRLQIIPLHFNVSFVYNAEQPKQPTPFPLGTILMVTVLYFGYRFFKKNNSSLKMQIDQGLNLKKYEPIKPQQIKTYFKDVAGMHEAKQEITQFVDFLKNPDKYIEMGAKIPKGALLTGPPGTGKTLLARACAGEAGVPFFYVSGSEFVEKYVGLGANRVRSLFQSAAKAAPSIIFIDEIDAIGKKRNSGPFSNEQKENTLNQMLVNMDGFDSKNKIIVMAATNLKDSLDPALLRPGRFDRSIEINLPNFEERIEILKVHLSKVTFSKKFTIEELAKKISVLTPGFSGAELANICNQAAILAARDNKKHIDLREFQKATERVMAGLEKRNLFSDQQKQCLAYYECGKAVAAWFTEGADPVIKISIAPYSKSSTGYSHEIKDEMPLKTRSELLNKAVCYLAGRMAQQNFKGYTTNNGDKDLKKAKRIVTFMVSKFGMSNLIGRIGFPDIEYVRKPYSQDTQSKIDSQIKRIFEQCQQKAKKIILQKVQQIQKLKKLILQKQTLTHNTLKQVLGERPFSDNQNYQKFLKDGQEEPKIQDQITVTPPAPQ